MIWRGQPLSQLTNSEFTEAVMQNNRLGDAIMRPDASPNVRREWHRKALALAEEGKRRFPGFVQDDMALWNEVDEWLVEVAPNG